MTKLKKLAAAISALCVAASALTLAPVYAGVDGGTGTKAADWDFDTNSPTVVSLDSGNTSDEVGKPDSETKSDGPTGNYKYIDANTVKTGWGWSSNDWAFGGFKLDNPMTSGKWSVEFDFNLQSALNGYSLISLVSGRATYNSTNQIKLINGNGNGDFLVNGSALTGDLNPVKDNWYHYKMEMDKAAGTYTVTVSDGSKNSSTGSGKFSVSGDFDGFMIGAGLRVYFDNILIKEYHGAPTVSTVKLLDAEGNEQSEADPSTAAVKIIFSEEMDEDSLEDAVSVTGAGDASLSEDGTEYYVEIEDVLTAGEELTVKVTTDAKSVNDMNLESEYKKTYTVANPNVLLNIDFDENSAALEHFHDYTASSEILTEENGNKYMKISNTSGSDSGDGFRLNGEIPTTGGNYTLSFDFMLPGTVGNIKYMCLNEHLKSGNGTADNAYNQFGLLRTQDGKFYFNGSALDGEDNFAEADVWYSYTLDFNRTSGAYEIEIKTRDGGDAVGSATGTLTDANYSDGMRYNKVYNSIKFHYKPVICIDNLYMEKAMSKPTLDASSLTFLDKDGNTLTTTDTVSMLADKISLNFGESINARTVKGNIVLTDGKGNPVSFGYELSGTCVILKNAALKPGTQYKLKVNGGITGASGQMLYTDGSSYTFEFKTEEFKESATLSKLSVNGVDVTAFRALKSGEAVVAITAENTSENKINHALVIAYYDENGKRVGVSAYDVEIEGKFSGTKNVDVTIVKPDTATSVKIMLWDSLASVVPVSGMLKF